MCAPRGAVDERQRGEHGEPGEVGHDEQPPARQAVDQRAREQADRDGRQQRRDPERAHPPGRVRALLHLVGERDRGHPRAERRPEGGDEEQAEAGRGPQER